MFTKRAKAPFYFLEFANSKKTERSFFMSKNEETVFRVLAGVELNDAVNRLMSLTEA